MTPETVIQRAAQEGLHLRLDGDRIAVSPKSKFSLEMRELIKAHRAEVIQVLSGKKSTPPRAEFAQSAEMPNQGNTANIADRGSDTSQAQSQADLIRLTIESGIFDHGLKFTEKEVSALVPPSDWRDTENCTREELKAWASALAMRAVRYRGIVPAGWDKVAHCAHCGPVFSFAAGECLACPWCEQKRAGVWFPVPE